MENTCKCKVCGWIGKTEELQSSAFKTDDGVEIYSDYICPGCKCWLSIKDYKMIATKPE